MIKKMRRKLIFTNMLLLTAMLLVVLFSAFSSSAQTVRQNTNDVLYRVIDREYSLPGWPQLPGTELSEPSLPYFTVQVDRSNTVFLTASTYTELENSDTLLEIVRLALEDNRQSGAVKGYNLRYLREDDVLFTRIAFVDTSSEQSTLKNMFVDFLQIGLISLVALFALSCLLAWWAVRPAAHAFRRQKEFMANASHELKTPLTVILTNSDLLRNEEGVSADTARRAEHIHTESVRMKALVEEMLLLERADSMAHKAPHETLDLADAVTESALLFETVAYEKGKSLRYDVASPLPVTGDRDKLERLAAILLDNAVKYGAEGREIRLTCRRADNRAVLSVENYGKVIPKKELRHLFDRFYRADRARTGESGFGLGLSIAEAIVSEHRGRIRAESDARSTRFIVTLPLTHKPTKGE